MIIDLSHHNDAINWKKAKAAGVEAAILRAGRGRTGLDRMFIKHIEGAIAAGLPVGVYYFSYAYTPKMARREAGRCLEIIKPYKDKITLPVFFDWEYDSMDFARQNGVTPGRDLITKMHEYFLVPIEAAGYRGGYYTNNDYLTSGYIDTKALSKYVLWYARYISTPQKIGALWQYTETGKLDGIRGTFDLSKVLDRAALFGAVKETAKEKTVQEAPVQAKPAAPRKSAVDIFGGVKMRTIKKGSTGKAVRVWQIIAGVPMDGIFGDETREATIAFQAAHKLEEDGIVGPITWKAGLESLA